MPDIEEKMGKLGFGLMRLPMKGEEIDLDQLIQMVDLFLSKGFVYFDTAYGYHGGKSETAIRAALVERYPRERFQLATKLPAWFGAKTADEAKAMFWTSLERTGAGYFDRYLCHNCGGERTAAFDRFGVWDFLAEQKREGRIRSLGFSFHDKADVLDALLTEHPEMDFVQLQINYADWENDYVQSRRCYEVARAHGKPIIVMEPVKGGSLAMLPAQLVAPLHACNPKASLASWGIRFAASLEGVAMVLSGMSTLAQMRDNVSFMEHFTPLSAAEQAAIVHTRRLLDSMERVPCTDCRYCAEGCPGKIKIAPIFAAMNILKVFGDLASAQRKYQYETREGGKASECIACRRCEAVCPQHISIVQELRNAALALER